MNNEIIYVCNSTNNKNVRANELAILRKNEEGLFFEFGENEINIKKRFYNDLKTLNKDYDNLLKLKKKEEESVFEEKTIEKNKEIEPKETIETIEEIKEDKRPLRPIDDISFKNKRRYNKKNNSLF